MKSIRGKIWAGMMLLVGMIIVILWLFQIIFLDQFYSFLEIGELKKSAGIMISSIENLDAINQLQNEPEVLDELEEFIVKKQVSVEIIDADYNIVYQAAAGDNFMLPGVMRESLVETIESTMMGTETKTEISHPKFGYKLLMIGLPVLNDKTVEGVMVLIMPAAAIEETVRILKIQLVIITFVLLFISLLVSYKLSKSLADPILKISRQAENYAAGKYNIRTDDGKKDELGELAGRMNRMGEALAENDKLQKELIANVSHELRTPLTLIRGYAETIRDVTGENTQKREKQLGVIIEEAQRLGDMIEDILNLSKLQSGSLELIEEPFSLKEMLDVMKEHYELNPTGGTLLLEGVVELKGNLLGDKSKIQQVLYNLIGNAFRYSDKDMPVVVAVQQSKKTVRIEVRDQGDGIAQGDLPHIFERYYKGIHKDGRKSSGSGLGLAIVKSILEMHQSKYGVESELGKGSVFWFELNREHTHTSF